ncbi:MAG: sterol desaturase family protein [Saprospiraceae bacterium]|nr:sterol desaturase family protein [Saprospiraceae bacterium]
MEFGSHLVFKYVVPIFLGLMVLEFIFAKHHYNLKETASSLTIATVSTFIAVFTKAVAFGIFIVVFEASEPLRVQLLGYSSLGWAWYVWLFALIADDFNFYWHHRLSHTVRLLWAFHIPHHNANTFNLSVSLRNGWFITLYKPIYWLWLPLIGVEPVMVAACLLINGVYQLFLHSQLVPSLGFFEKVFNSPYLHRVHHSCNPGYLDKNHGGVLIIWDKLFGTFQDVIPSIKPKYGVLKGPDTLNPVTANTHEFQNIWRDVRGANCWADRIKYIFWPPGWSPNGSLRTARVLNREFHEQRQ